MPRQAKRIIRDLTDEERDRLRHYRRQITGELPALKARTQSRKDAREESTLSGELRRSIHGSDLSLAKIAVEVGLTAEMLDEFLTGERTLRSDVMDRLALALGYELHHTSK